MFAIKFSGPKASPNNGSNDNVRAVFENDPDELADLKRSVSGMRPEEKLSVIEDFHPVKRKFFG